MSTTLTNTDGDRSAGELVRDDVKIVPTTETNDREDLRAAVELVRLPWPEQKARLIERMAGIRKAWRRAFAGASAGAQREYRAQVALYLSLVEETMPEAEVWSAFVEEAALTPEVRLGEHISVTRRVCGLLA